MDLELKDLDAKPYHARPYPVPHSQEKKLKMEKLQRKMLKEGSEGEENVKYVINYTFRMKRKKMKKLAMKRKQTDLQLQIKTWQSLQNLKK